RTLHSATGFSPSLSTTRPRSAGSARLRSIAGSGSTVAAARTTSDSGFDRSGVASDDGRDTVVGSSRGQRAINELARTSVPTAPYNHFALAALDVATLAAMLAPSAACAMRSASRSLRRGDTASSNRARYTLRGDRSAAVALAPRS